MADGSAMASALAEARDAVLAVQQANAARDLANAAAEDFAEGGAGGVAAALAEPPTPRTAYGRRKNDAAQMSLQLMMHLDRDRINSMERQFARRGNSCDLREFVRIMLSHLPEYIDGPPRDDAADFGGRYTNGAWGSVLAGDDERAEDPPEMAPPRLSERALVANLTDLFQEVDINGDGSLEWAELTSFIVEKAVVFKERFRVSELPEYCQRAPPPGSNSGESRRPSHAGLVERLHYIEGAHQVSAIEANSPVVAVYDANTMRLEARLEGQRGVPMAMQHVARHNALVTCCADMTMVQWNLGALPGMSRTSELYGKEYKMRHCWPTPHVQMCLAWVEATNTLYSGSCPGLIHTWDLDSRHETSCIHAHNDIVMDLITLTPLDNVVSASLDKTVAIWDTHTSARRQELRGHTKGVTSLAYSEDYRTLVSAGFDHEALVWSPFVPTLLFTLKGHSASLIGVEAVPGTPEIITADRDGYFKLWDLRNFQCVQTWSGEEGGAEGPDEDEVRGTPNLQSFVHVSTEHADPLHQEGARILASTKRLLAFEQGTESAQENTADLPISCACYNTQSLTVLTATERSVRIWDAVTGNVRQHFRDVSPCEITAVCLDDRERKFILGDVGGNIGVYNFSNGALMKRCVAQGAEIKALLYCTTAKAVISATAEGIVAVHDEMDPNQGVVLRRMDVSQRHRAELACCGFSHALSLIATGAADCTVKVWDFETGKLEGELAQAAPVTALCFCGDYPLLAAADSNGTVRVWGLRMSMYKYECVFAFLHGPAEPPPMVYESAQEVARGRYTIYRPAMRDAEDPRAHVHVNRADAERQAAEAAERSRRLAELAEADPEEAARQAAEREAAAAVAAAEVEAEAEERRAAIASNHGQIPPPKGRFSRPSAPSMVMTMTFVENRIIAPPVDDEGGGAEEQQMMMHTGDDDGCVHRWDMTAAFRALKMAAVRLPKGTKVRRRASFVPHLQQCSPPTIAAPVSHAGCIQAHADAISLLHLTSEPTGLLTASFDRTVSFWTRAGGKCGTLVQGLLDGSQNPGWSLPMDVTDREAREAAQLDGMMARVGAVEGGAGGGEGGAQGGEAGAPARRPSVLELVQERHKEKEKGRAASLAAAAADEALAAVASAAGRGGAAAAAASSSSSSSSSSGGDGGGGGGLLPNERRAAVFSALDDANRSMGGADGDDDGGGSAFGGSSRGASRGAALDSQPGEWRAFKSTLPPIEKMSTSEFAKVADRQRGKPDPKAQTAAGLRREIKERKRRAGMLRSRAELAFEQTGRVPTPKPKPPSAELDGAVAFSSHTRNAVALLAQSIADWDHQPNVPDDEGADES